MYLAGDPPLNIAFRRSARARRMTLRVSGVDGRVTLSVPRGIREGDARAFAEEKADWIRARLAERIDETLVGPDAEIPFCGATIRIALDTVRAPVLRAGVLMVPGPAERSGARVAAFLKQAARAKLATASDRYAQELGASYCRLTLRDTRSRWGSCSARGNLMYSWRLIMAPAEVLEYVAAHEVAHLVEMNHSKAFWRLVEGLDPEWRRARDWLRLNGQSLHSFRFTLPQ